MARNKDPCEMPRSWSKVRRKQNSSGHPSTEGKKSHVGPSPEEKKIQADWIAEEFAVAVQSSGAVSDRLISGLDPIGLLPRAAGDFFLRVRRINN